MKPLALAAALAAAALLGGCDLFGTQELERLVAAREADGRAIGAACRHAGRALEDCYTLNGRADKAAVFAGWREMNDYMRENGIEAVTPQLSPQGARVAATAGTLDAAGADAAAAPAAPASGAAPNRRAPRVQGS